MLYLCLPDLTYTCPDEPHPSDLTNLEWPLCACHHPLQRMAKPHSIQVLDANGQPNWLAGRLLSDSKYWVGFELPGHHGPNWRTLKMQICSAALQSQWEVDHV